MGNLKSAAFAVDGEPTVEGHAEHDNGNVIAGGAYLFLKRLTDIVSSAIVIIVTIPAFLLLLIAIKTTSKGPAIYKQKRIGKYGCLFTIYKFRTMVDGADNLGMHLTKEQVELYKVQRKLANDPRVTGIGKFLRKTSIDELPQIYNIFLGNMSIVGPRPMMLDEVELYGRYFNMYTKVKPGLTGLWQVRCRKRTKMRDRARLDCSYIIHRSFLLDFAILFKTFSVVFSKKGAC